MSYRSLELLSHVHILLQTPADLRFGITRYDRSGSSKLRGSPVTWRTKVPWKSQVRIRLVHNTRLTLEAAIPDTQIRVVYLELDVGRQLGSRWHLHALQGMKHAPPPAGGGCF